MSAGDTWDINEYSEDDNDIWTSQSQPSTTGVHPSQSQRTQTMLNKSGHTKNRQHRTTTPQPPPDRRPFFVRTAPKRLVREEHQHALFRQQSSQVVNALDALDVDIEFGMGDICGDPFDVVEIAEVIDNEEHRKDRRSQELSSDADSGDDIVLIRRAAAQELLEAKARAKREKNLSKARAKRAAAKLRKLTKARERAVLLHSDIEEDIVPDTPESLEDRGEDNEKDDIPEILLVDEPGLRENGNEIDKTKLSMFLWMMDNHISLGAYNGLLQILTKSWFNAGKILLTYLS